MKTAIIILVVLLVGFTVAQAFITKSTSQTEGHDYDVIKDYGEFQIRKYKPALFSYTVMEASNYKEVSSQGFRILAGYIFGANDRNQKIAMTTPVTMTMDDSVTMKFKIPDNMDMEDLPKPSNSKVRFATEPSKVVAAIRFGGWSTDSKIKRYTEKLDSLLLAEGITHLNNFSYLGYNPPYEMFNRRNEIVVEVKL